MKNNFNHSPFVSGITVPFNGHRLKDPYFITDKEGNLHEAFPNGGGWHLINDRIIEHKDVTHIRLSGDKETKMLRIGGGFRLARDIEYFGKEYPIYCGEEHGFVHLDEVPLGHRVVPVSFMGYRDRKRPGLGITIFITQAKLLTDHPYTSSPKIIELLKHSEFWQDPNSDIMSCKEIINSLYQLTNYGKIETNIYTEPGSTKNLFVRSVNSKRGPETNLVDSPDWEKLSKFLTNPTDLSLSL